MEENGEVVRDYSLIPPISAHYCPDKIIRIEKDCILTLRQFIAGLCRPTLQNRELWEVLCYLLDGCGFWVYLPLSFPLPLFPYSPFPIPLPSTHPLSPLTFLISSKQTNDPAPQNTNRPPHSRRHPLRHPQQLHLPNNFLRPIIRRRVNLFHCE